MESLKKHGDPLEAEIRRDPARGVEEVASNQPGSKGDGSRERAGSGGRADDDGGEEPRLVRSANQKPNPAHPADDATMAPGGDLGQKRNTM
ncbi:MAG TPA: hypothetical protein VNT81_07350 [Vicinamibacterales bacterium]|nr:hypothetical protein [Vicinamibacterales bacterium]